MTRESRLSVSAQCPRQGEADDQASAFFLLRALRWVVVAKLALHALFLPLYDGPDEPFHLARARAFAASGSKSGEARDQVDAAVVRSIRAWPCGADLRNALGCPPFGSERAWFNTLGRPRAEGESTAIVNYEAHQPPFYYLAGGTILRVANAAGLRSPERQLLLLRLFAVLLVALALWSPAKGLGRAERGFEFLLLAALLAPGAAESLIRTANDAAVFSWAVLVLLLVETQPQRSVWQLAAAAAVGPLLKLTALPVAVFAALRVAVGRRWAAAAAMLASASLVFPLQWLRGWSWGGTLEANTPVPLFDSIGVVLTGLARSALTLAKTAIWLGGWVGFRAPRWLLISFGLATLFLVVRAFRPRWSWRVALPHLAATAVALVGFAIFAIGQRRVFGVWGAVGGWYVWGWVPWLCLAFAQLSEPTCVRQKEFRWGTLAALLALNVSWFAGAISAYSGPR